MENIIKLLPDSLANQIAAGEVVQRPASAVKECMENSIDAGAKSIKLILKDGGKLQISIIDDGKGMTPMDARMSFERHATSKLSKSEDLFNLKTMGFRGEALASIAAVAQVELVTRQADQEVATRIIIEGSTFKSQEISNDPQGTSIHIRNLFFNVPARRNFLKSHEIEKKHCIDEFVRIALSHPEIKFELIHNDEKIYHLPVESLKARVINVFKKVDSKGLLEVLEETPTLTIHGIIGSPSIAKKKRGDQFLYVNGRFIKSPYIHHAINAAYENMLPDDHQPFYILFLEVNPSSIDVNVHPTKQEIKFEDEGIIYNYVRAAIKHTLSFNLVTPTLDFTKDVDLNRQWNSNVQSTSPNSKTLGIQQHQSKSIYKIPDQFYKENLSRWKSLYENLPAGEVPIQSQHIQSSHPTLDLDFNVISKEQSLKEKLIHSDIKDVFLWQSKYIVWPWTNDLYFIDPIVAHKKILYESFLQQTLQSQIGSQTLMFPVTIHLLPDQQAIYADVENEIKNLGFEIEIFENGTLEVKSIPSFFNELADIKLIIEEFLDLHEQNLKIKHDIKNEMAKSYANHSSIKLASKLSQEEMKRIVIDLLAISDSSHNFDGRKCYIILTQEQIVGLF